MDDFNNVLCNLVRAPITEYQSISSWIWSTLASETAAAWYEMKLSILPQGTKFFVEIILILKPTQGFERLKTINGSLGQAFGIQMRYQQLIRK